MTVHLVHLPEDPRPGMRLGRSVEHDDRSRAYAIAAAPLGTLVSVRHKRLVPAFDQKDTGSCTGNACAGVLSTRPFHHHFHEATARLLYSKATQLDEFPGTYPPDDTGSTGLAVAKAAQKCGYISSYRHGFSLEAMLTALQTSAVLAGIAWRSGQDHPDSEGHARYTGSVRGGHEICLDELDVERQRVWWTNSWSDAWGQAGRAWMTFDEWGAALADSGDVTVLAAP